MASSGVMGAKCLIAGIIPLCEITEGTLWCDSDI
jgi:hypothetical protein